jgi:hypothetical protein
MHTPSKNYKTNAANDNNQIWIATKKSWHLWFFIIYYAIGLGIFKLKEAPIVMSSKYTLLLIVSSVLIWLFMVIALLFNRITKLENKVKNLTQINNGLQQRTIPSFFIENLALSSLMAHIELKKRFKFLNPVDLDLFKIHCKVLGTSIRLDAQVTYNLKGMNLKKEFLTGLYLSISGDNLIPFQDLNAVCYNRHLDSSLHTPIKPVLKGKDSIRKDIFLPFINPGIKYHEKFEIELSYKWPGIFNSTNDYWFLDNLDYKGYIKEIVIELEFADIDVSAVRAYSLGISSKSPRFIGIVSPDADYPSKYVFRLENPKRSTYYILVFNSLEI